MKMDSAIPVEVARFRLGEQLVADEECGATRGRLRTAPAPLFYSPAPLFPEGSALCRSPPENLGEFVGRVLDSEALRSPSRAESPEIGG